MSEDSTKEEINEVINKFNKDIKNARFKSPCINTGLENKVKKYESQEAQNKAERRGTKWKRKEGIPTIRIRYIEAGA